tara:strand:+ start:233 stop:523 length:291 start_codon:yes stop_codon:yes gene_type:complete
MSEDNNKISELEQRIKTSEDQIKALNNDIDALVKVLTKMKKDLYYTVEEDKVREAAAKEFDAKRDADAKKVRDEAAAINMMRDKNIIEHENNGENK